MTGRLTARALFIFLVLLVLCAAATQARTWHVPSECPTIRAGLDSASSGDTVLVGPGTYSVSADPETWIILKPGQRLLSEGGPETAVIEFCGVAGGVFLEEGTRLRGFTITYVAQAGCEDPPQMTEGVYSWSHTDVIVENCIIEDCGIGIEVSGPSLKWGQPIIRNNVIRHCQQGIACSQIDEPGRPLFDGNTVAGCGWGAFIQDCAPLFDRNQITHCSRGLVFFGNCTGDCSGNTIAYNGIGADIWADPPLGAPTFNGSWEPELANDFYGNTALDIRYDHPAGLAGIMAIYNYWGSSCPNFAGKLEGEVIYSPWMDSTHTVVLTEQDCPGATEPSTWGSIKAMFR